jgi:hypothetical protein
METKFGSILGDKKEALMLQLYRSRYIVFWRVLIRRQENLITRYPGPCPGRLYPGFGSRVDVTRSISVL